MKICFFMLLSTRKLHWFLRKLISFFSDEAFASMHPAAKLKACPPLWVTRQQPVGDSCSWTQSYTVIMMFNRAPPTNTWALI